MSIQYLRQKCISIAFRRWIKGDTVKSNKYNVEELVGISLSNMRSYIESQWQSGMTWQTYGILWNFDHVAPLSLFDHFDQKDLKLCWHFLNIRPVLVKSNKTKSASLLESIAELDRRLTILSDNPTLRELKQRCEKNRVKETTDYEFLRKFAKV